jgi:hypothetical protein
MLVSFVTTLQDDSKDSSMRCDVLVFWDAMIFCNTFARWLQKIVATCMMCWFFWDATIFCNNFASWLQKIVACDVLVFSMLWTFVTTLQDDHLAKLLHIILQSCYKMIFCNNFARWSSCKVVTYHLAKLLQKMARKTNTNTSWFTCFYYLLYHLANLFQKIIASNKINASHHITCCYYLLYHLANLLRKIIAQSTESPILFRSCGHETQFSDQNGASKIGDSVLWHTMWRTQIARFQDPLLMSSSWHAWVLKSGECCKFPLNRFSVSYVN